MAAHSETGTMAGPKHYTSKELNHLGLVAGMYDELEIGEFIDRVLPQEAARLYPQIAAPMVQQLGLSSRFGHLNLTGFHTDGQYNGAEEFLASTLFLKSPQRIMALMMVMMLSLLFIAQMQTLMLNLDAHHSSLLRLLGRRYDRLYSGNG